MCRKVTSAMKMINSIFQAENMDAKELSAKAKMLLASYRHVCWASIGFCRVGSEEKYMICDDDIDQALTYLVEFSPTEDKRAFESNLKALFDSKWMMELVDDAMVQVKEFPDMGDLYFELLSKFYLSKFKYGENEMPRRGEIEIPARVTDDIKKGIVNIPMHFTECAANMLTNSDSFDPKCKMVELKACAIQVEKL